MGVGNKPLGSTLSYFSILRRSRDRSTCATCSLCWSHRALDGTCKALLPLSILTQHLCNTAASETHSSRYPNSNWRTARVSSLPGDPAGLAPQWVLQEDFQGPTCCQSAEWLCGVHALAKLHISLDTFKVFISYCLFISVFPIFHFPLAQINKA